MVDGGMVSLDVISKAGPDVIAKCVDPGIILSRANLTFKRDGQAVRARNAMLPVLSSKVRDGQPSGTEKDVLRNLSEASTDQNTRYSNVG